MVESQPRIQPSPAPAYAGWFFLRPDAVPPEFKERAETVLMLPLLPDEARAVLGGTGGPSLLESQDEGLARLVARGMPTNRIATELRLHPRTVQRRVARLRERFGSRSTAELATQLARSGF